MIKTIITETSTRKIFEYTRAEIDTILLMALGLSGQDCVVNIGDYHAVISAPGTNRISTQEFSLKVL